MDWTRSEIHQLSGFWIGLDSEICNVQCNVCNAMYIPYLDLRQFLLIVTLTSEVLPSNLQLFTSSFVLTCRFYKVFGRYLLCCVRIGLDWIQILVHQLDWTGLGSVARGFGLDWIVSTRSIPYSAAYQISMQSAQPLPRNSRRNICDIPPGSTRHVPQWVLA